MLAKSITGKSESEIRETLNHLGPMVTKENEGLHEIWKAPMTGFFTYGEYGEDPEGNNKMHSTTCSWVVLKQNIRHKKSILHFWKA